MFNAFVNLLLKFIALTADVATIYGAYMSERDRRLESKKKQTVYCTDDLQDDENEGSCH